MSEMIFIKVWQGDSHKEVVAWERISDKNNFKTKANSFALLIS
jgi:hypothetical protein